MRRWLWTESRVNLVTKLDSNPGICMRIAQRWDGNNTLFDLTGMGTSWLIGRGLTTLRCFGGLFLCATAVRLLGVILGWNFKISMSIHLIIQASPSCILI
jgi:hypothetical protein